MKYSKYLVLVLVLSSCASMVQSEGRFHAILSVAAGVQSQAQGQATFQISADGKALSYTLTVTNLTNVTMAHIYVASAPGQSGDVAVWLYPSKASPMLKEGEFSGVLGQGTITAGSLEGPLAGKSIAELVASITLGVAYVNVHTSAYPDGEIQGTIVPESGARKRHYHGMSGSSSSQGMGY